MNSDNIRAQFHPKSLYTVCAEVQHLLSLSRSCYDYKWFSHTSCHYCCPYLTSLFSSKVDGLQA